MHTFATTSNEFNDKVIFVTGGTGSFGKHFVRTLITQYNPKKVIIFSRDELKQFEMAQEYTPEQLKIMRFFLGDVRDEKRLNMAMEGADYVVHAAALKQVPAAEYNPMECVKTNINGANNVVNAAIANNVHKIIALSTDKGANPVNLYGATKLVSDKIFVAANNIKGSRHTMFSVVRYGNVIGSRGSVIPFFKKKIQEGASTLPITDPRMTRFFITLEQGIQFVLSCFEMMQGGEIFIPKIPSATIADVARVIAPELEQETIGIRPGEKLHELMISVDDGRNTLELEDRYVIQPSFQFWDKSALTDKGATSVPEDFYYSSDANDEWLQDDQLDALIKAL